MQSERMNYVIDDEKYELSVTDERCSVFWLTTHTALECRTRAFLPQELRRYPNECLRICLHATACTQRYCKRDKVCA